MSQVNISDERFTIYSNLSANARYIVRYFDRHDNEGIEQCIDEMRKELNLLDKLNKELMEKINNAK